MRITRGLAALSVATVAVLGLSACSSDSGSEGSGSDRSASAEQEAPEVEDAGFTPDDFAKRVTLAAIEAGSVTMTMSTTTGGVSMDMTADVEFTDSSQNMRATADMEGTSFDMIVVDGVIYMSMGELTGGKYIAIDPNDTTDPNAASFAGITDQLDPTSSIKALEGAIVSVDKSGDPIELDGVQAQPYTVVVDTSKINNPEAADLPEGTLPDQISYEYWIGPDDLMRKIVMEVDGSTVEMLMTGWGEALDIAAPPADQITDMSF